MRSRESGQVAEEGCKTLREETTPASGSSSILDRIEYCIALIVNPKAKADQETNNGCWVRAKSDLDEPEPAFSSKLPVIRYSFKSNSGRNDDHDCKANYSPKARP